VTVRRLWEARGDALHNQVPQVEYTFAMRVLIVVFALVTSLFDVLGQDSQPIPESERRALDSIYQQAGGDQWKDHQGWAGARGSECGWHGVSCESTLDGTLFTNHVVRLELVENNLRGIIPETASDLSRLHSVWLWGNELSRIPVAWLEREDLGEIDLRLWGNPIEHRITEISMESVQGDALCAHWMFELNESGKAVHAAIRCRDRSVNDRDTYCEVKETASAFLSFPRLARFVEKSGFYDLKRSYTVNQTHAGRQIVRVTRDGKQRTIDDYGYMEPLRLFGIEIAVAGVLPSIDWETTTRHPEEHCRAIFSQANDVIHLGVTYLVELPPDVTVGEATYVRADSQLLATSLETVNDGKGKLLTIESMVANISPSILNNLPLVPVTLGGRQAMEHREEQNGMFSREVYFPTRDQDYVHLVYRTLSRDRAIKADLIIDTVDEKTWD
jgi:hypothetical protein